MARERRSSLQITEVRIPRIDPRAESDSRPPPAARERPRNRETLARDDAKAEGLSRSTTPSTRPSSASLRPGSLTPGALDEHGALVRAARLHRQIAQLQEQLADVQRELSIVNRERASEAERNDELRAEILVLQGSIIDLEAAVAGAHERVAAAKDRERELEAEVKSLRDALKNDVSDGSKKKLEAELRERDVEIAKLRGEMVDVKALKNTRSRELSAVRDSALAADLRAKEAELERDRVRSDLVAMKAELDRVTVERSSIDKDLVLKREELEHLRGVEATLRGLLSQVDSINRDLVRLVGDAERSIQSEFDDDAAAQEALRAAVPSGREPKNLYVKEDQEGDWEPKSARPTKVPGRKSGRP